MQSSTRRYLAASRPRDNQRHGLVGAAYGAVIAVLLGLALSDPAPAQARLGETSGLALPRFVSLAAEPVNMRAGPGTRYPITWVYRRKGLPMLVINEFDLWYQLRDSEGAEGWVHRSLLSGRRMALVRGGVRVLRRDPKGDGVPLARLEPGVLARIDACAAAWCEVAVAGRQGWLPREAVFGVLPDETLE